MDYLDFGSSSDSDDNGGMLCEDSDEEERQENKRLLKLFSFHEPPSKNQRDIQDFEAEMEAELDRRAQEVEVKGGMEHQKSLSRSSSNTSLNKSPRASPVPGSSSSSSDMRVAVVKKSNLKRSRSNASDSGTKTKSVKFSTTSEPEENSSDGTVAVQGTSGAGVSSSSSKIAEKLYDELYFDSDDEDGESKVKEKRRFMTDEELFYDPSSDAKDQAWIDRKRRKAYGENKAFPPPSPQQEKEGKSAGDSASKGASDNEDTTTAPALDLPSTDAILNCPACFTVVCHDCQRHDLYVGQYRAMFVSNCVVNKQETLKIPEKKNSKKNRKTKQTNACVPAEFINDCGSGDVFHPVVCKICRTQIAMYDSDEVYHFFNVLASQP